MTPIRPVPGPSLLDRILVLTWGDQAAAGLDPDHTGACGGFSLPHRMSVDSEGTLHIAQFGGPWIDKYVPKPGADPSRLIGQPLRR